MMTEQRARALIAAYGADPARWPQEEREAALTLIAGAPELSRELDLAQELDASLSLLANPTPSPALRVVLNEIPERAQAGLLDWLVELVGLWRPAAGLAVAAMLGVVIGVSDPSLGGLIPLAVSGPDDALSLSLASAAGFGEASFLE